MYTVFAEKNKLSCMYHTACVILVRCYIICRTYYCKVTHSRVAFWPIPDLISCTVVHEGLLYLYRQCLRPHRCGLPYSGNQRRIVEAVIVARVASSPGPAQKLRKGPGVTCKDSREYVLCQQSLFGVEESHLSIANYQRVGRLSM